MVESLARIKIKIIIADVGQAEGELNRLTAPLTVGEIVKRLPISGRVITGLGLIQIIIDLKRGTEKPVTQVEAGTIAFWPQSSSICVYSINTKTYGPVNKIGKVLTNIEIFKNLKNGSRIIIEKV
jgi:hypothetical protein